MKKKIIILLMGLMLSTLTACGGTEDEHAGDIDSLAETIPAETIPAETIPAETIPTETISSENTSLQIQLFAENKDLWMTDLEYADEVYQCALTDLDENGRLELIAANMGGTGIATYSRFFEVNEAFDGITECTNNFIEGDSQPDIIEDSVDRYLDENGMYHYIFTDLTRNGAAEHYYSVHDLTLQQGTVSDSVLARHSEIYSDASTVTNTYEDASGNEITEEAYNSIAETVFAGCKKDSISLTWLDIRELEGMEEDMLIENLQK